MKDAELSLAVAKIMWPECEFKVVSGEVQSAISGSWWVFDHTTDDALGKMCVWLANDGVFHGVEVWAFGDALESDNPHRAVGEAIVEASE